MEKDCLWTFLAQYSGSFVKFFVISAGHRIGIGKSHIQISSANKLSLVNEVKSKRMAMSSLSRISEKIGHCLIFQDLDIIRNSRCNREKPIAFALILTACWLLPQRNSSQNAKVLENISFTCVYSFCLRLHFGINSYIPPKLLQHCGESHDHIQQPSSDV